jgi:hypothetical protein
MPEDDELDEGTEHLDPAIRAELKRSRQLAKDLEAANARAAEAERESAFARAGVSDSPLTSALAKTYDGENDPESIRAYFTSLGVDLTSTSAGVATQHPPAPQGPSDEELAAQRRVSQLGSGGEPGGDIRFEDALQSANSESAVMELIRSAPEGAKDQNGYRIAIPEIN